MDTINRLCTDPKTNDEAKRLFRLARANTAAGSGFDVGEDRVGLPAVCAYLASLNLNNTHVTREAAQHASCQRMATFKRLLDRVQKALETPKAAHQKPLDFGSLREQYYSSVSSRALPWMGKVEEVVMEHLEDADSSDCTEDEIKLGVFIWVCNVIEPQQPLHVKSFKDRYTIRTAKMRDLNTLIEKLCRDDMETKILEDYRSFRRTRSATSSPHKSPAKRPQRTFALQDSPQKRAVDAEDDFKVPESPTKRRKVVPGLVTFESIRPSSPTKAPLTPTKSRSPSKSPTKKHAAAIPADISSSSDEEEDHTQLPRRRFRPVFRDQGQWAMCDPRIAALASAAAEYNKRMINRYGPPFQDARNHGGDVDMGSD
ncbi:hypothetical protein GGX14DRAFT_617644 [Mycena pura]|uniref:Uncharacterized protein n=1 Tax=Mycena pura TaxID=153505 RepID=A0AAD6YDR1_9AGAR|nr:hypothetical protein GGX14DRAFT_617644 [Mycena pura]